MEAHAFLYGFMQLAREDPRIGTSHISLYLAILYYYHSQACQLPLSAFSRDLMKQAKIGNRTYHSCMADLVQWGYIKYIPSYNPVLGSLIYLQKLI